MTRSAALVFALFILPGQSGFTQTLPLHAPDGGTREMLTSIAVPPLRDAPFAATVNTEWTRYLENGATRVLKNHRLIARDSAGRVFQERRWFAPDGAAETRLTRTEIADPATHVIAYCEPSRQVCELRFYAAATASQVPPAGVSPAAHLIRQDLGTQTVNGLEIIGTREVQTVNAETAGTDRPLSITKEFWYSPRLGLNISTKRSDPRSGTEVFIVTDITTSEPDANLFTLPKGAHVVDYRQTKRPALQWGSNAR